MITVRRLRSWREPVGMGCRVAAFESTDRVEVEHAAARLVELALLSGAVSVTVQRGAVVVRELDESTELRTWAEVSASWLLPARSQR